MQWRIRSNRSIVVLGPHLEESHLIRSTFNWPVSHEVSLPVFPNNDTFYSDSDQGVDSRWIDHICDGQSMRDVLVEAEPRVK